MTEHYEQTSEERQRSEHGNNIAEMVNCHKSWPRDIVRLLSVGSMAAGFAALPALLYNHYIGHYPLDHPLGIASVVSILTPLGTLGAVSNECIWDYILTRKYERENPFKREVKEVDVMEICRDSEIYDKRMKLDKEEYEDEINSSIKVGLAAMGIGIPSLLRMGQIYCDGGTLSSSASTTFFAISGIMALTSCIFGASANSYKKSYLENREKLEELFATKN